MRGMAGIVSYGSYIPYRRLKRAAIAAMLGVPAARGERAVASFDEDSVSMAVEALRDALKAAPAPDVRSLVFATTTPPYAEKLNAALVGAGALLPAEIRASDSTGSIRAGLSALLQAADAVAATGGQAAVAIADSRLGAPEGKAEQANGDGAAAFLLGNDHVIAEIWDEAEGRWRLVDPEMNSAWTPEIDGRRVDWMDLADDQFVTGPRAWQAARAGKSDPARHVVAPNLDVPVLRGWPYIAHNAIHDLAALNKTEMLLWEAWGMQLDHGPGLVPEPDAAVLDEVCARTAELQVSPADVAALADRDGLRVPATVTRFDPYGGPPREVTLRG